MHYVPECMRVCVFAQKCLRQGYNLFLISKVHKVFNKTTDNLNV